uniref:GG17617 n=1 Tax=Drosophila erecta TaxID=7220 RepID=B3P1M1_DROER
MRPAVNQGFKPDTVIVESGFRPIVRTDGTGVQLPKEIIDQVAHRREDPGTEIDEVMETDTLFLTAQQGGSETQSFEPMFIPSPLDSTNATKVLRVKEVTPTASALRLPSAALEHALPSASELRKPTLGELFGDDSNEEQLEMEPLPEADDVEPLEETTKKDAVTTTKDILRNTTKKPDPELLEDLFGPDEEELYADELELDMDDRMAAAAERIDTYYLPPDNRKIPHTRVPSGALYTFDGKSVVDSSLVLPPKLNAPDNGGVHQRHAQYGLTPLEQLVRTTPQFGVYRGELPQEFRGTEPQPVSEYSHPAALSRTTPVFSSSSGSTIYPHSSSSGASTSTVSSSSSSPLSSSSLRPISTKLQLLKPEGRRA